MQDLSSHIDDEYARAAERDPKILLTTSREPSSRLSQFVKAIVHPLLYLNFCVASVIVNA